VTGAEEKGVLWLTLRRPEKRNALSRALLADLAASFRRWSEREDLCVAVLTGEGEKAFASGGDLDELRAMRDEAETLRFAGETRAALDTIRRFPVPVVAALNGDALGGGAELAMACDLRVAAPHARIGFLQGRLNIATAWGGGTDLLRLLGSARALLLLATAEAFEAKRAQELGLVDAVAPAGEPFRDFVAAFATRLAARKPQVMRAFKALAIAHRFGASSAEMAQIESRAFAGTWVHADHWAADALISRTRAPR
jgi:enoyl-CoA hydratase